MDRRPKKQLIYAASFFAFCAVLFSVFYFLFLKPAPSCFDGIQNQGEEGVDCGGPCAKVCIPQNIKPLVLADRILILRPAAGRISLLTQVSNPNYAYAARSFSYSFNLLDANGGVVQTFSGNSFIYAGEVKYVLIPNVALPSVQYVNVDFKISGEDWVPAGDFAGPPKLNTTGAQTDVLAGRISVDGNITNVDTIPFSKVTIIAVFRGKLGEVAGASQTEVENLVPNVPRPFSVIHPPMQNIDVLGTKIFSYAARE